MKLIGIPLRKPAFAELTAATMMAVGLWAAAIGLLQAGGVGIDRADAGALLLTLVWACLSTRLGIRVGHDRRHLAVNAGLHAVAGRLPAGTAAGRALTT